MANELAEGEAVSVDPKALKPGTVIAHKADVFSNVVLADRKSDDSGWWIVQGGGLLDTTWSSGDWYVVSEPACPVRYSPARWNPA